MMITERGNEEYVEDEIKEALSALSWNQGEFFVAQYSRYGSR